MVEDRGYQRRYLRAPFMQEILYVDHDFVFKAEAMNISEGGMLLRSVGHFPADPNVDFMIKIPQYPFFKNFNLDRLKAYSLETLPAKIIRFKASLVRKIGVTNKVDGVFASQIGLKIEDISPFDQAKVANYVDTFASNLIYLQVLLDTIDADSKNLEKIRLIADFLGYGKEVRVSYLRKIVEHDYKSLQWL